MLDGASNCVILREDPKSQVATAGEFAEADAKMTVRESQISEAANHKSQVAEICRTEIKLHNISNLEILG